MSAIGGKADIARVRDLCLLMTQSGHSIDLSELKRRVVNNLLHNEERACLPNTGQCDQLLSMQAIEVGDVLNPDFEKVVEISGHEVAVEYER